MTISSTRLRPPARGLPAEALLTDPDVTASYATRHGELLRGRHPGRRRAARAPSSRSSTSCAPPPRCASPSSRRAPAPACPAPPTPPTAASCSPWSKMDRILEINPVDRIAVVEPGVINAVLSRAVAEHGLYYPPDPSSWEQCTIGGNIGTASGGLCCVKYGVTAEYVLGLDVVLADGRLLTHRPPHRQGRRRLRPHPALRRLRGQPRHRRPGRPRPASRSRPQQLALAAEFPSAAAACDAVCADHGRRPRPVAARTDGPYDRAGRQRPGAHGPAGDHRGAAARRLRHPRPGRRPRRRRRAVHGRRRHRRSSPPRTPPSPNCCSRPGGCRSPRWRRVKAADDDRRRLRTALAARRDARRASRAIAEQVRPDHRRLRARGRRQHPPRSSASTPPTPTSPGGPASPSTRSWRSAWSSAAPSPANTASAS